MLSVHVLIIIYSYIHIRLRRFSLLGLGIANKYRVIPFSRLPSACQIQAGCSQDGEGRCKEGSEVTV